VYLTFENLSRCTQDLIESVIKSKLDAKKMRENRYKIEIRKD